MLLNHSDDILLSSKIKIRIADSLYKLANSIQIKQFKKSQHSASQVHQSTDYKKKPIFRKVRTARWSKYVTGVNLITTKGIPLHHLPDMAYNIRTLLAITILNIGYTLKGTLSKKGFKKLLDLQTPFVKASFSDLWITDKELALKYLQGSMPQVIRKVKSEDRIYTMISDELIAQLTDIPNKVKAIDKLYLVDMSIFEGIKVKEGCLMGAPQVLFFQDNKDSLLKPIAISIRENDPNLYTPLDHKEAWVFAKLNVLYADILYMPLITHVVNTHFWIDPVIVATDHHLPIGHPIQQLLYPHFKGTIPINKLAYFLLLKPKALFDQISVYHSTELYELVSKGVKEFTIEDRVLPVNFKKRGIEGISYYPYRDDAKLLWEATNNYVKSYINTYYKTETEIWGDKYIADWWNMLEKEIGLNKSIGFSDFLSAIIYNSIDHNIHQNSIMQDYLDPYHGRILFCEMPKNKSEINEDFLFNSLGHLKTIISGGMLIRLLTDQTDTFKPSESDLSEINSLNREFMTELSQIEEIIKNRNKTRIKEYTSAFPSKLDNAIKI